MESLQTFPEKRDKLIDSNYYVEGYAMNFERYKLFDDWDGNPVYEQFRKEDFDGCDMSDVIMQYDHAGRVLARQSNGSLKLQLDGKGLFIGADLSRTDAAKQLYGEIAEGMVTKMSWCFIPSEVEYDPKERLITYKSIKKIYDVSAVSLPANDTTSISARSLVEKEMEKVRAAIREAAKRKLRLKLMLELPE